MRHTSSTILREVRHDFGNFGPILAASRKMESRAQHGRVGADERVSLSADHGRRYRLALEFRQFRFVIEQIEVARVHPP